MNRHSGVHRLFFLLLSIEVTISPFVNFNHVAAVNTASLFAIAMFCFVFGFVYVFSFMFHSFGRDVAMQFNEINKKKKTRS